MQKFYVPFLLPIRPVTIKPVGRIFEISDVKPIRGKNVENAEGPSNTQENKGLDTKTLKMGLTGFNVTSFR